MDKINYLLEEWFQTGSPLLNKRHIIPENLPENIVINVCGVRRAGKTYSVYELADKLKKKYDPRNIVYFNLEDIRLYPLSGKELLNLPKVFFENYSYNKKQPVWFLIDEIQNIPNWERTIRSFVDRRLGRFVITGSNSLILPENIAGSLRGRSFTQIIYPLSFKEFLNFKKVKKYNFQKIEFNPRKTELLNYFKEYLEFGGFPQIVLMEKQFKKKFLSELFTTIFYRDILEKYPIRNVHVFEAFIKLLAEYNSSLFSITKLYNFLKNTLGYKLTKNTLFEYLSYAKKSFLLYDVELFSYKVKDRYQYPRKVYFTDTGIINSIVINFSNNFGKLLENAVFLELKRRSKNIFYWKSGEKYEVDFLVVNGHKVNELIQVAWELQEKTKNREIRSLLKAMDEFNLSSGKIITRDLQKTEKIDNKTIEFIPFYMFA